MTMRRDRDAIEQHVQERGQDALLRVKKEDVEKAVKEQRYHHFEGTTVTVCLITLDNGFTIVGHSACADPRLFDPELGRRLAFDDAKDKVWAFLGFRLRDQIHAIEGFCA
jgi:hypothetical protein